MATVFLCGVTRRSLFFVGFRQCYGNQRNPRAPVPTRTTLGYPPSTSTGRACTCDIVRGEMASFVMNEKQTGVGRMRATLELQPIWEEPSVVHIPCDP